MNDKYKAISLEWINFLERFSADQINIKFTETEKGFINYSMENVYDTNITLCSKYGFLTVKFEKKGKLKDRFLELANINYSKKNLDKIVVAETTYFEFDYPCRVYPGNNLLISFYDKSNYKEHREKLRNRILVFQNVLLAIIRLKIEQIKPELF